MMNGASGLTIIRPLCLHKGLMDFRCVQSKGGMQLYMLDLKERRSAKWIFALKCAFDAAVVCRLDINFNEFDIVEFLLTHGIHFHILCPSNTIIRTPSVVRLPLDPSTRPAEFVFDGLDYLAYRERCNAILKHSQGRAALMCGHYMWQLAMNTVPWEAVLDGPSGWMLFVGRTIAILVGFQSMPFFLLLKPRILGNGDQVAMKSWYMPVKIFEGSAQDLEHWSSHTDLIFRLLDKAYDKSEGDKRPPISQQPHNRGNWFLVHRTTFKRPG